MMEKLRLTVNEKKTRQCLLPEETFHFLGFTFGTSVVENGSAVSDADPAEKKVLKICERISEETSSRTTWRAESEAGAAAQSDSGGLGQLLPPGLRDGSLAGGAAARLPTAPLVVATEARQRGGGQGYPDMQLYEKYGLVNLRARSVASLCGRRPIESGRRAGCGRSACPVR